MRFSSSLFIALTILDFVTGQRLIPRHPTTDGESRRLHKRGDVTGQGNALEGTQNSRALRMSGGKSSKPKACPSGKGKGKGGKGSKGSSGCVDGNTIIFDGVTETPIGGDQTRVFPKVCPFVVKSTTVCINQVLFDSGTSEIDGIEWAYWSTNAYIFENLETCASIETLPVPYSYIIDEAGDTFRDVGGIAGFFTPETVAENLEFNGGMKKVGVIPIKVGLFYINGFIQAIFDDFNVTDSGGEYIDVCEALA